VWIEMRGPTYITKTKEGTRGNPLIETPSFVAHLFNIQRSKVEPLLIFLSSELKKTPASEVI
jgi:hypothetical protein